MHELFPEVFIPDEAVDQAWKLQEELTRLGQHRCASVVDLVIAVTAQLHDLTVLHHDRDFETIARITGQATCRIMGPTP